MPPQTGSRPKGLRRGCSELATVNPLDEAAILAAAAETGAIVMTIEGIGARRSWRRRCEIDLGQPSRPGVERLGFPGTGDRIGRIAVP